MLRSSELSSSDDSQCSPAASGSLSIRLTPGIHECHTIRDLLRSCTYNSVVLLDCDNTILRPKNSKDLGSEHWFTSLYTTASTLIADKDELLALTLSIYDEIQHNAEVKTVEFNTKKIIKILQDIGLPVYVITSRGSRLLNTTERQLREVDYTFSESDSELTMLLTSKEPGKNPAFKSGVIYCDGANKGHCANEFFSKQHIDPAHVVMMDNTIKHLNNSHEIFSKSGRMFIGLHYKHLESREKEFDMRVSAEKLASIHHLFSPKAKTNILRLSSALGLNEPAGEAPEDPSDDLSQSNPKTP